MAFVASALQTTFAAVSFTGAGYLFKMFDKNGYEKEMKHHNRALEDLAKAKEEFYEKEVKRHNRIQELRQQLSDAYKDINTTNNALDELRQIQSIQYKEPQLSDYYKLSDEMKDYRYLTISVVGISSGYMLFKYT